MLVQKIRLENLRNLVKTRYDGIAANMALAAGRTPGQINNIIGPNPTKSIGEKIARKLENKLSLPEGYLDQDHTKNKLNDFTDLSFNIEHLSASLKTSAHNNEEKSMLNFTEEFFKGMGVKPQDVSWFEIQDESMEPTLKKGSRVIVNKTITTITSGDVYAVMIKDRLVVRRIFEEITGYRIACDNVYMKQTKTPDIAIEKLDENIKILGKVIWYSAIM